MNCREFIAEFEERRSSLLSQTAQLHLNDCPGCKKTSGKQTVVWQMIDGLKRVDAPNDFDFRVKAKIAGANPADFQSRFLPALRYVLPLCLIALVLGLLAFNTSFFFGNNGAPHVADAIVPQTPEREITPVNSLASDQIAATNAPGETSAVNVADDVVEPIENRREKPFVAVKSPLKAAPRAGLKKNVEDNFVGVRDLALSKPTEKFPVGINPSQTVETLPNVNDSNSFGGEEALRFLGIEAVRESGKLKVKTIRENSSAARSDVKVGDVIDAIDGVKLSAEPVRAKRIEVKNLTVIRGTEKIEIVLQTKAN